MANGRVQLVPGENGTPFYLFSDAGKTIKDTMTCDALKGMEANSTTTLFLSPQNLDAVQEAIRYQVYLRSEGLHVIGRQSDTELVTVMRSMYLQYGRNTTLADGAPDIEEIRRLNGLVITYSVDRVLAEINIYLTYRQDISKLPVPMQRGAFESNKGSRFLVQKEF
jgi:hypothetical protein